jgi:putative nucleotidyltransferase with HDIG domain
LECHQFEHNINKLEQEKSGEKAMNPHERAKELLKDLFEQSHETVQHSFRLKIWGQKLGRAVGISEESVEQIGLSCLLHDIGKTTISQDILNKEEKLSNEEWEKVKKHCEEGAKILRQYKEFENIADYILYHHEHWDGSGYPEGLKGYDIPLIARIIAIADAYDVMTHERGYSKVISKSEALLELERKKDKQFDPDLVDIFIESMINIEEIKSANQA